MNGAVHRAPRRQVTRTPARVLANIERAALAAAEHDAIAAPLSAFESEENARRRAVELELGLGLNRRCDSCNQWIALADWRRHAATGCPVQISNREGRN